MRLIRNRPGSSESPPHGRSVVTIGNFDGIHLGHQALVNRARECLQVDEKLAVVSFEPLPQAFFRPEMAPARLSSVRQKLQCLAALKADVCWLMRFDLSLAQLSPEEFVRQVLVNGLACRHVVVGEDFRFGHRRAGDVSRLAALGRAAGFTVEALAPVLRDCERISSTLIRQALQEGDFERAARLLGRPFRMQGRVVPGKKLGRTLDYPTANLRVRTLPSPVHGIFAVYVRRCHSSGDGPWLPGVASLGNRPTVGGDELLLEVHVFDFSANLYGQRLQVEFVAKLRDELHFPDMESLQAQMKRDDEEARQVLASRQHPQPETTGLY